MPIENSQIKAHKRCIEILEAAEVFRKRAQQAKDDALLYQLRRLFGIAEKKKHQASISRMAFDRLMSNYQTELTKFISA